MGHPEQDNMIQAAFSEGIWEVGLDVTFASGKKANNKVDLEGLFANPEDPLEPDNEASSDLTSAGLMIVNHLVERVDIEAPEVIAGVPTGGQRFAMAVGKRLKVPVARFVKDVNQPGLKTYKPESVVEREKLEQTKRLVIVEDATTELTSVAAFMEAVLEINPDIDLQVQAILRRDTGKNERAISAPINWLIELDLPNILYANHPTYRKWGNLAKGEL